MISKYAFEGEKVTCENGHEICTIGRDIIIGQMQDVSRDYKDWKQTPAVAGSNYNSLACEQCGAKWIISGPILHFAEGGWRGYGIND
jgi:hypothetical protein